MQPLLTVFLLTYNHEQTIKDTCESILKQKTQYPFIVKILEDCSTDKTLDICKSYVKKYPNLFQLISQPINTKGKHMRKALDEEIKTTYFTIIEGDDYYINEHHLEKAIQFLQNHKNYNLYASCVSHQSDKISLNSFECQNLKKENIGHDISMNNYIYLQTSGRVYRYVFDFKKFPPDTVEWDIFLYWIYLDKGKSFFDHEIDSVYRVSSNGIWNSLSKQQQKENFINVVYKGAILLQNRHANFFIKKLPKCKIKKFRKFIGSYLTLRLFLFMKK